ncbi:MAG: alpha/beta hydrolase [Bacteroidetes bacterium]|nr:alpha/beta hydrolase [Bacteroidota bacterium]
MKRALVFGTVIVITSILSIIIFSKLTEGNLADPEGVTQAKLYSSILGEERGLIIHLPRGYDSTKLYPVMYVLDGGSQDTHIAAKFDVLTTAGYTPKTIIVGIPNMSGKNREHNLIPPFMRIDNDDINSEFGNGDKFLNFMESELIPFVESNYRASQVRLLSGNSRGGLLVMYSLLYRPNLFQARFCYSTPFWRQDNILVSKVDALLSQKDTLNTFIYLSAGENETENIKNGLDKMTKKLKEKAPIGLVVHFDYTPNATHQNNSVISASTGIARWSEYLKR